MKVLTVLGARPQFIKAGSISREIAKHSDIKEIIVHTGQHYDKNMSDVFFEELHLPKPSYNLGVGGKSQGAMTGEIIIKFEEVMLKEKPDIVLVYGDTNSTLAGAITASKLHVPIAHVEAGLRSFNMKMPEEINRILTDRVSKLLFCPTDMAVDNLKREGFPYKLYDGNHQIIKKVGDVMCDAAMYYKQFAKPTASIIYPSTKFILCTVHRAENTGNPDRLKEIFEALIEISKDTPIILPLHPRTLKLLKQLLPKLYNSIFNTTHPHIHTFTHLHIIEPVGYLEMIWLLDNCKMVITDSGGLQKEAFFFHKPCITLRDETEWVELVKIGANIVAGADRKKILNAYKTVVDKNIDFDLDLYGKGQASQNIISVLISENI